MNRVTVPEARIRSVAAIAALVAVVLVGLGIDRTLEPAVEPPAVPVVSPLLAGAATCAAVVTGPDVGTTVATMADASADVTDPAPWASLDVESAGAIRPLAAPDVTGRVLTSAITGDVDDVLLSARWEGAPLLLARRWEQGSAARIPGAIEGPCPSEVADRWIIPGVATAGGAAATLHLANPTDAVASLAVTFLTPAGRIAPTRLANIVVPAHGRTSIELNEFAPEEPDLGVEVVTRSGRVVVEAVQSLEAAVGGIDGHSLVVAHTAAALTWTLPWVSAAEGESAWIWVTNPGETATDVGIVLHTANGPIVPPASGLTLGPGTTQRLDLRGALAEVVRGAVTVRSTTDEPIVVSGAVLRASDEGPSRGGIAVIEAAPEGDEPRAAALSTIGEDGRTRFVSIANPGAEEATLDVLVVGRNALTPRVLAEDLVIAPGAWTVLDLAGTLPIDGGFGVLLDISSGQAVGAIVSESSEGPLDLTATLARPFPSQVLARRVVTRQDRSLLHPVLTPRPTPAPVPPTAGFGDGATEPVVEPTGPGSDAPATEPSPGTTGSPG